MLISENDNEKHKNLDNGRDGPVNKTITTQCDKSMHKKMESTEEKDSPSVLPGQGRGGFLGRCYSNIPCRAKVEL